MQRTQSEVQLCEDMETAEQRDLNMFYRLVNGIRDRQMNLVRENESSNAAAAFYDPAHDLTEAERSLAHIIHTRNAPVDRKSVVSSCTTASSLTSTTPLRINANATRTTTTATISARRNSYNNYQIDHNYQSNHHNHNHNHALQISLNSGVPILEEHIDPMHQEQQQQYEKEDEWAVGSFNNSSSIFSIESELNQQQHQHQQHRVPPLPPSLLQLPAIGAHDYAFDGGATTASNATTISDTSTTATTPMFMLPTLYSPPSSSEQIFDEGMFDFEL